MIDVRIAYVNGRYLPLRDAMVHVEDRGYQFADGVYEVCEVRGGRLIDERRHLDRLERSLDALRIAHADVARGAWRRAARGGRAQPHRLRHRLPADHPRRGAARPSPFRRPTCRRARRHGARAQSDAATRRSPRTGIAVVSVPDNRWGRVDIKTVGLLPNVLARQAAHEQGAREAWFVDKDGSVTEGASTNAWIVTPDGTLVTRHADHAILRGITRTVLLDAIKAQGLRIEERAVHARRRPTRRAKPSSPRRARS